MPRKICPVCTKEIKPAHARICVIYDNKVSVVHLPCKDKGRKP